MIFIEILFQSFTVFFFFILPALTTELSLEIEFFSFLNAYGFKCQFITLMSRRFEQPRLKRDRRICKLSKQ